MATGALIFGFIAGLIYGAVTRHELRKELKRARAESLWREDLLAKKVENLCECGHESQQMALAVEPAEDPEQMWREDYGGEAG